MRRRGVLRVAAAIGLGTTGTSRTLFAQRSKAAHVGVLVLGNPPPGLLLRVLREGLAKRGYVEGQNLTLVVRSAEGRVAHLSTAAAELVELKVDVIVAWQTPAVTAAQRATKEIPIVMSGAGDPVGSGFIASLSRPGGNITGLEGGAVDVFGKSVEFLRLLLPTARRIAALSNAIDPFAPTFVEIIRTNARVAGFEPHVVSMRPTGDLDEIFAGLAKAGVEALIVQPSLFRPAITELALKHRLPSISGTALFAHSGGLIAYTASHTALFDQTAGYVERILKGAAPAELPVARPTTYELVINLKTARALGLTVPPILLIRADEVIE